MRGHVNLAWVALSAALFAAAFPPLGIAALAPIALVPLLVVAARASAASAAGHGLLFGLLVALGVAGWLPATLARFFGLSPGESWLAFAGLALALLAVPFAAFALGVRGLARHPPVSPLAVAGLYGGLELARLSLPVPNPWALFAATQPPGSALLQLADLGGACGVGMLLAGANAWAAGFVAPAFAPRRPRRSLALAASALALVLGYGGLRLGQDFGSGAPLRLALVAIADEPDALLGRMARTASAERAVAAGASARDTDLVVLPEHALPRSLRDGSPESRRLLAEVAASRADWLFGAPHRELRAERARPTNSVFLVRQGRVRDRYDKAELLPFAEASAGLGAGRTRFTAGMGLRTGPLQAQKASLGVLLCSEALLPERARALVRAGAELLVNPSYDAWLPAAALEQELRIAALRAIENRRPLLRAAAGGRTAVVDPHGRIVAALPSREGELLVGETRRARSTTPYQRIGDAVPLAGAGLAAVALWRGVGARRRSLALEEENDR